MGGLFSGGEKTTTQESDPYANMPKWLEDSFKGDVKMRDKLLKQAGKEGPQDILDINDT